VEPIGPRIIGTIGIYVLGPDMDTMSIFDGLVYLPYGEARQQVPIRGPERGLRDELRPGHDWGSSGLI